MNNGTNDCQRISRRVVLTGTARALVAAAAATAVSQAAAQQEISQADAQYQGTPKGDRRCDGCVNFQPVNACKFVQGDISPARAAGANCLPRRPGPGGSMAIVTHDKDVTALLVIDPYNDFISEGGKLYDRTREIAHRAVAR